MDQKTRNRENRGRQSSVSARSRSCSAQSQELTKSCLKHHGCCKRHNIFGCINGAEMLHNWASCGLVMQCITASGTSMNTFDFFRIELVVVLYVVFCIFYGMDFASLMGRSFSVFHAHSEPSHITSHYVASAAVSSFQLLKQSMVSRKGRNIRNSSTSLTLRTSV